jgi:large subunit ribosomal protein L22
MEIIAQTKSVRVSSRKVRLVADAIRKLSIQDAMRALEVIKNRGAFSLEKTLRSAIANALAKSQLSEEALFIKSIDVVEGPAFKRFHASTRGRAHPYKKKSSHIKITLAEKVVKQVKLAVKKELKTENLKLKTKKNDQKEDK